MKEVDILKDCLIDSPLIIEEMDNQYLLQIIDNIIPYSIGFEIECNKKDTFNLKDFTNIPNIMDVNVDSGEQRFRIPSGRIGAICLKNICDKLFDNSIFNKGSGIHYHCDMTETFEFLNKENIEKNKEWILKELDTWNYRGNYNSRNIGYGHNWIRLQSHFKTAEFRIGEMTFDYSLMMKRIIHISDIIKKLNHNIVYQYVKPVAKKPERQITEEEIMSIISNRTIKRY